MKIIVVTVHYNLLYFDSSECFRLKKTVEISNNILNKMLSSLNYFSAKLNIERFFSFFRMSTRYGFL